ncbi:MAG TPA: type II secretion system protein GspK [Verrucomicrobiota bacterium]|nr:type II secretion system protein GspK [Verrucomicrobiota bacterium]
MTTPASQSHASERGIAMVIVMISITVLSMLAAGFAYSMKVETKLARNANSEAELEWLGRSGVEYARWVLGNSLLNPLEPYDALEQPWATGYGILGPTNNPIGEVQKTITLGRGSFTWTIIDLERKFNINSPEPLMQQILPQALNLMGVSPGESTPLANSIFDWVDPDDQTHIEGAENRHYESGDPPYFAKNGPIDDMAELLFIKGVTPEIYYGLASTNYQPSYYTQQRDRFGRGRGSVPIVAVGLTNIFTPLSTGRININTASAEVLQVLPGVDPIIAEAIISGRAGEPDPTAPGMLGPYRNVGELNRMPDIPRELVGLISSFCDVRSKTFQVQVDADVGGYKRTFFAILGRNNQRDVQVLSFYWK